MTVKLLTKYHLKFLSLNEGCAGSSESIFVKIPHCWKSHVRAQPGILALRPVCKYMYPLQIPCTF